MPRTKKHLKETDLYVPVRDFLQQQGFEVRSEVMGCDIAATKGDELLVVEMKLGMNITLLAQAADRQRMTDLVYLAVPKPSAREYRRRWPGLLHLVRRLELGLIFVSFARDDASLEVVCDPQPYQRRRSRKRRQALLKELAGRSQELNRGGSRGRKLVTAYREQALHIAWWLHQLGPQSPRQLRQLGTGEKTTSILYRNFYGWYEHLARGLYGLSERGATALEDYPDLVRPWEAGLAEVAAAAESSDNRYSSTSAAEEK